MCDWLLNSLFLFLLIFSPISYAMPVVEGVTFEDVQQLRQRGSLLEAERKVLKLLEVDPSNPDLHFELANIYAARYDRWSEFPNHPKARGLLEKSGNEFEQVAMFRPEFIPAHFNLGVVYKKLGRYEESRHKFKRVLGLDPNSAAAWMQIGATYEAQGFFYEARDAYKKAKQMDYTNSNIQGSLDDLDEIEKEDQLRRESERAQRAAYLQSFQHSAFSHAADQQRGRRQEIANSGNSVLALPYVATALVQQFMQSRAERRVND